MLTGRTMSGAGMRAVEDVDTSRVAQAPGGVGGEGFRALQVGCDSAPCCPAIADGRGELSEVAGDSRQIADQCQSLITTRSYRQRDRGRQRRRCRVDRSI